MKLILWHMEFLSFKDKRVSTRPSGIRDSLKMKSQGEFNNVLAVFTCVEQDDEMKQVDEAAEEVCKTLRSIGSCRNVVIVPFVHLSGRIARPEKAIALLRALYSQLKSVGLEVDSVSFGYHKTFELHFRGYGHPLAVAYRSFPRD